MTTGQIHPLQQYPSGHVAFQGHVVWWCSGKVFCERGFVLENRGCVAIDRRHHLGHDDPVRIPRPEEHQFVGERGTADERDVGIDHGGVKIAGFLDELRGSPGTRTFARTTTRSMHFLSSARCSTSWCRQRSPTSFASRSCQETMCRRTSWSATTAAIRGRPHERQRRPALRHHRRRRRLVPASPASAASRLIHIADELNIAVTVRYCVEYAQA